MKPTLVVLAAGMGSRYGGIKQIDPIGPAGETFIDYSTFDAAREGFGKAVFIIRDAIKNDFLEVMGDRLLRILKVEYAMQELDMLPGGFRVPEGRKKPWGTGHALLCARNAVDTPFLVINADDFYGRDSFRKLGKFLASVDPSSLEFAMAGYRLSKTVSPNGTVSRGVCSADASGNLISAEEHTKIGRDAAGFVSYRERGDVRLTGNETVSMNCWGFTPAVFPLLERKFAGFLEKSGTSEKDEFFIPFFVNDLIREKVATVKVLPTDSPWFGITYREDRDGVLKSVAELTAGGEYPVPVWGT